MRDTVPDNGLVSQNNAESTSTQLLDEQFSEQVPKQRNGEQSLSQTLYRQLNQRLASAATDSTGSEPK
jgi:Rod binding domain-containing protein